MPFAPITYAALVSVALVAGFVDAIAGGGGLLTLPALLAAGLPPHVALGTNKGQSVFGSGAALVGFARAKLVDRATAPIAFGCALVGSFAGARLALLVSPAVLRPLIVASLGAVAAFLALSPRFGARDETPRATTRRGELARVGTIALGIGAYDGFFGPGTGTFAILASTAWLGMSLTRASANAKALNFGSNLAAVALFASTGRTAWAIAFPMGLAQLVGASLGARLAIAKGSPLVRAFAISIALALVAKLSYDMLRV